VIGASAALEKTVGAAKARADRAKADVVLLFAPDRAGLEAKRKTRSLNKVRVRSRRENVTSRPIFRQDRGR
jgi:hypothetical protein